MDRIKIKNFSYGILIGIIITSAILITDPLQVFATDFSRPDGDPGVRWINGIGLPPCDDLTTFDCVDEPIRDDSDYIQSLALGKNGQDIQLYTMSDIPTQNPNDSHFLRYTLREGNEGTNPVSFTIELRQASNTIATFTHTSPLPTTFTMFQQAIDGNLITDYSQLELTLTANCDNSCANSPSSRERVAVSWIEFAVETTTQPPTLTLVQPIDEQSLQLFWNEPLDISDITDYEVQRDSGSGFTTIAILPVGTTNYLDAGLQPSTTYTYQLISISPSGNSLPSNQLSGTTSTGPVILQPDYSRPDSSDDLRWVGAEGCPNVDNYQCIDEEIRDDLDYIQTIGLGKDNQDTQFMTMSDIIDPIIPTTHVLRYTLSEGNEGTNPGEFEIRFKQGPAIIESWIHPAGTLPSTLTLYERIITNPDLITDYNDLEVELIGRCDSSCANSPSNRESIIVTWLELELLFPVINLEAKEVYGQASLIEWEVPIVEDNIEKYIIKRSENSGPFLNIIETPHDTTNRVINQLTGRQYYQELDTTIIKGNSYQYEVYSIKNQKETIEPSVTLIVSIPDNVHSTTFIAEGSFVNTTSLTPLSDPNGNPLPIIFFDFSWLVQDVQATHGNPLFTSSLNPKAEPHLIDLSPIPSPNPDSECMETLEIFIEKNQPGGQSISAFASIIENGTVKVQNLFVDIPDSNKRIFQDWYLFETQQSNITDYTDLQVQLDITSSDEILPVNWRQLSVYEVILRVPESSQAC